MTIHPSRILLVEDDEKLSALVAGRLRESNYEVETVFTGPAALEAVAERVPDLVLLDVMLPGLDGMEVCRRLRASHPLLYIMMLTSRSDELDRVVGLEVGADDYVTKPFSLQELMARIRSALRRIRLTREQTNTEATETKDKVIAIGDLVVDPQRRKVTLAGDVLHLTVREFDLLLFLASQAGRPFSRSQLLAEIWDIHYEGYDRTIDSHIQRLRAKVETDPGNPQYVRTVWGVGYKFAEPEGMD